MKKSENFLTDIIFKRKYDLLFIIYVLCFPAVACLYVEYFTVINSAYEICLSLLIGAIVYLLSLNFVGAGRKIFLWFFYIIVIIPSLIVLSYIVIDGTLIRGSNFFIVFETNYNESSEFISEYFNAKTVIVLLVYILPSAAYLVFSKKCIVGLSNKKLISFKLLKGSKQLIVTYKYTAIILLLCGFFLVDNGKNTRENLIINFYKSIYSFRATIIKYRKCESQRNVKNFIVKTYLSENIDKTFVIVIGEALSKHHMSLYGYKRKTSPLLEKIRSELIIYDNVISPHTHTLQAMKYILTFADSYNEKPYFEKPSIIEIFNNAGFETYWIENQTSMGKWENTGIISKSAKRFYMTNSDDEWFSNNFVFDEKVLVYLDKILKNKNKKDKLIFIHLLGNHAFYRNRYPPSFEVFNNTKEPYFIRNNLKEHEKKDVNQYDNSVLYNDFVVTSIFKRVKKSEKFSFVLYFSDHGEEVHDIRDYFGHTFSRKSAYMCEIPFILWLSEDYKKAVKICVDTARSYSTENLIYSVSDLARLKYNDYDASKSIFSDKFIVRERKVGEYEYEKLKTRTIYLKKIYNN